MGELFIFTGDDDFERKRRAKALILKLSGLPADAEPEENAELEVIAGDADDAKAAAVAGRFLDALRTPPFLTERKLLWMRHYPDLDLFNGENEPFASVAALLAETLPPEVTVVVDGPGFDQRKQFARKVKNAGARVDVCGGSGRVSDKNWAENRRNLIRDFIRREGRRIDDEAMQFLVEAIGGDTGTLTHELEKLVCYAGNAPFITLEDCRAIISRSAETLGWEYTGALLDGNGARALTLLHRLLVKKGDELKVLAMVSREFKQMVQTHLAMRRLHVERINPRMFDAVPEDVRAAEADNFLLAMHPYRAFKLCEAAMRRPAEKLAENLVSLRDSAKKMVTGGDPLFVLEQLTLDLARR
ncbi:MAG: DNA polymerase III subunit delta [Victivallaceae bacterium]|nr:DNA polymerase III subunit delta [Victivallaceae bacterium]